MLVWAGGCSRSRSRAAPYRRCKKATLPLAFVVRRAAEVGALRGGAASAVPEARSSQACTRRLLLGRHWGGPRRLVLVIFLVCSCAAAAPCSSCPLGNQFRCRGALPHGSCSKKTTTTAGVVILFSDFDLGQRAH
jgi:hypothetical protein